MPLGRDPASARPSRDDEQPDEALGLRRARAASLVMLGLPGSAYLYQGEELGLPEHTTLDDDLRQDPTWSRSAHTERGRDGCRVPLPWAKDEAGFGFSPTGATWLPQPASWAAYALDAQQGVAGSTYETYRNALRLRGELELGTGSLAWADAMAKVDAESALACSTVAPSGRATGSLPRLASTSTPRLTNASSDSASTLAMASAQASDPVPSSSSPRSRRALRYVSYVEPATPCCASSAYAAHEAGCGSHVAPVGEKPNPASSFAHGSGTRQPSRPRSVCAERDHVGSWRKSSSSVVCSGRPSSSPW